MPIEAMTRYHTLLHSLASQAMQELRDVHASAGCNDLQLPDSAELRQLVQEYDAWNLQTTVGKLHEKDESQLTRYKPHQGQVLLHDGLVPFAIHRLKEELRTSIRTRRLKSTTTMTTSSSFALRSWTAPRASLRFRRLLLPVRRSS